MDTDQMNTENLLIKKNIKEHYSRSGDWRVGFKNKRGDSLNSKMINFLKRGQLKSIMDYLNNYLNNQNNQEILDAGCGNGEYSLALARKYSQSRINAVDFSESMCNLTKKRAQDFNLMNIDVSVQDINDLPFAEGRFDSVLCVDLLHHVPNTSIVETLLELARVMKRGGLLVIDFKNKNNLLIYLAHRKKSNSSYYLTNRTYSQMRQFLFSSGFEIVSVR